MDEEANTEQQATDKRGQRLWLKIESTTMLCYNKLKRPVGNEKLESITSFILPLGYNHRR